MIDAESEIGGSGNNWKQLAAVSSTDIVTARKSRSLVKLYTREIDA